MPQSGEPSASDVVARPLSVSAPILSLPSPGTWGMLPAWPGRRWLAAFLGALGTVGMVGLTTAMIPNPVFGRSVPTTWWAWPVLLVTGILAGLLGATYVRGAATPEPASRSGVVGGLLSYLAVGCPVCNKVALLALGYTGALQWFAPVQPVLAAVGVALLGFALWRRLQGELACPAAPRSA